MVGIAGSGVIPRALAHVLVYVYFVNLFSVATSSRNGRKNNATRGCYNKTRELVTGHVFHTIHPVALSQWENGSHLAHTPVAALEQHAQRLTNATLGLAGSSLEHGVLARAVSGAAGAARRKDTPSCEGSGPRGEMVGCRFHCSCNWHQYCFPKIVLGDDGTSEDAGECGLSVMVSVALSILVFFILIGLVLAARLILLDQERRLEAIRGLEVLSVLDTSDLTDPQSSEASAFQKLTPPSGSIPADPHGKDGAPLPLVEGKPEEGETATVQKEAPAPPPPADQNPALPKGDASSPQGGGEEAASAAREEPAAAPTLPAEQKEQPQQQPQQQQLPTADPSAG